MTLRQAFLVLAWGAGLAFGVAADDIDELFQSPPSDVVNSDLETLPPSLNEPVRPFVQLTSWAAGATDGAKASLYYETALTGGLDFRPDDRMRIQFSVTTNVPNGTSLQFSPPAIAELFVDYTPTDALTFRIGQFDLTWGQARLVTNAGNLVSNVNTGVTVKTTLAVPFGGVVFVSSARGPMDDRKQPAQLLHAVSYEQTWGPVTWGATGSQVSGRGVDSVWKGSVFTKASWGGADWYAESVGTWSSFPAFLRAVGTVGALWQGGYPVWTLNAEYQFERENDGLDNDLQTSVVAVSLDTKKLWSVTPKVLWSQDWEDWSGQLTPAMVLEPAPYLTVTAAVPWVYGAPGSRFVASNPDPEGRWWALGLKASLAWNY